MIEIAILDSDCLYFFQFSTKHHWNSQSHGYGLCYQNTGEKTLLLDIFRMLIIDNFIPSEEKTKLQNRAIYDEDEDSWALKPLANKKWVLNHAHFCLILKTEMYHRNPRYFCTQVGLNLLI